MILADNEKQIKNTSIGGQALIEGIMMRGPKTTAMAVRNPEGEIVLEKWETEATKKKGVRTIPVVRGIFNFIDSMRFGYKCLMRSAEIAGLEDEPKKTESEDAGETSKKEGGSSVGMTVLMVISVVLGVLLAVGLFVALPSFLYALLAKFVPFLSEDNRFLKSAFEGVLKVLILVGYLAAVSLMKDIRRTFMYHGGEHKTIFCYEQGLPLTVETVRAQRRFHPRCGTSFLILMILVSILISMLIPATIPTYLRVIIKLCLLPLIMGIGYELIKFAGKHDNLLTKIISAPGMWLQHLTVLEPDDSMIECAITAMKEVIPNDESDNW
ncbi:MAG: DUF1385 domain-containing protein [Clostridia bacterium]|nr:DUF1385 domain-containing protein [Clostridia bacterium]